MNIKCICLQTELQTMRCQRQPTRERTYREVKSRGLDLDKQKLVDRLVILLLTGGGVKSLERRLFTAAKWNKAALISIIKREIELGTTRRLHSDETNSVEDYLNLDEYCFVFYFQLQKKKNK